MEDTTIKLGMTLGIGAVVISIISLMYANVIGQQQPFKYSEIASSLSDNMMKNAEKPYAGDYGLTLYFSGTICTSTTGLSSCYQEIAEELNRTGLDTPYYIIQEVEELQDCQEKLDKVMQTCYENFELDSCIRSKENYEAYCYQG